MRKNMKNGISFFTGLIWVFAWFGFMLLYSFLDVLLWKKVFPGWQKYFNIITIALCTISFLFLLTQKNTFHIEILKNISIKGILLSVGCSVLFYFILDKGLDIILANIFPSSEASYQEALISLSKTPIITLIQVCLLAPVLEEILMRGFLLNGWSAAYGKPIALLISSLIFALLHFNMVQTLSAFFCGIVLGLLYLHTESLFCCILAHAGYNFISYITTIVPLYQK